MALGCAAAAFAFEPLPAGVQVNNDPAAGINPALSVGGEDPANADVVGGALAAGKPAVPWAIFRQLTSAHDQLFVRSFAGGAWTTRGSGTVEGSSSAAPTFSGSLNFDQTQDAEAPSIDFAGTGRTVPWASWYEDTTGALFGAKNIFASRFDNNSGDPNQGKWLFAGQARGLGGANNVPVSSLNIHTNRDAENPSIAGGSTSDPTKPAPWVTWQETTTSPVSGKFQIFVEKALGPGMVNCNGVTPTGTAPAGGFCWQDVGTPRVGPSAADPSLNVDPTRDAVEPDIAFTGPQDSVPWVVWYETGNTGTVTPNTLASNDMVFAAKAVSDGTADGGFRWEAVGNQLNGALGVGGTNGFGKCGESAANEAKCSLNHETSKDAEDPRVAAGTMSPEHATTPWVVWDEGPESGVKQVFVSKLVGSGAAAHFEILNGGLPISTGSHSATRPDITFSGNTPYVSWRQDVGGGVERGFYGHFVDAANPSFVLDESDVPLTPVAQADVREPISSSCTATPFNGDGGACQGGALGTPFFLFTNGTSPLGLFADAYQPGAPVTGAASAIGASTATLNGTVDPRGAAVNVSFQYGATTAYGSVAAAGSTGVGNSPLPFSAQLTGLAAGTTIHYRAVATSDFGSFAGADQTLTAGTPTTAPPSAKVSPAKASGTQASVGVSCPAPATNSCRLRLELTVTEKLRGHRVVAVSARAKHHPTHKTVVVGSASVTLKGGQLKVVQVGLNRKGKHLLAHHSPLKARLRVTQEGIKAPISTQIVTFKLSGKPR